MKLRRQRLALYLLSTIVLMVLPVFLSTYNMSLFTQILILSIFAMSANVLVGWLGLPTLGHAGSFGIGAYTVGLLTKYGFGDFFLTFPIAMLMVTMVSAIFGLLALRTTKVFFLMITFSLTQMLFSVAWLWGSVTGGDDGLTGIPRPYFGLPWSLWNTIYFYYFVLFFFIVSFFVLDRIRYSPFGLAMIGIRESESRMQALGYNSWAYKYIGFIVAGIFGGLSGILNVYFKGGVSPFDLSLYLSGLALTMAITGGVRVFIGPAVGAFLIWLIRDLLLSFTAYWIFILGSILLFIVIYAPQGITGYALKLIRKWTFLREWTF